MKKYEIMYIVNASLDDAAFKTVSDRLHATITENGGSIDKVDDWGVKEFAYEIDHMKKMGERGKQRVLYSVFSDLYRYLCPGRPAERAVLFSS